MTKDNNINKMNEKELNILATKIVSRMLKVKTMEDWFNHVESTAQAANSDYSQLNLSEETEGKCVCQLNCEIQPGGYPQNNIIKNTKKTEKTKLIDTNCTYFTHKATF